MDSQAFAAVAARADAGTNIADWDDEPPPVIVDWDAADVAGYHVDWDAAPVRTPVVMDWDNLSVHGRLPKASWVQPVAEQTQNTSAETRSATSAGLPDDNEVQVVEPQKPSIVDWDGDEVRTPIVMDWDQTSTRDTYPLPGRNSIMALDVVDWDRHSVRKPILMDWDKDAEKRPLVTDWDLIAPEPKQASRTTGAAGESDAVQSSEVRLSESSRRHGKKWVVDDVLLQAAAEASSAERRRVGPGRSAILRSNLVDWDEELEQEARAKEEAAKAKAEAEARAKAKAQARAVLSRPRADEAPQQVFGAGGPAWVAPAPEEPELSEISVRSLEITERPIKVEVEIEEAFELTAPPGVEAYVVAMLQAESETLASKNTETSEKSANPVWDEVVELSLVDPPFATELKLMVYAYMKFSNDRHFGTVQIPLESLPIGKEHSMLCALEAGESKTGKVQIYVILTPLETKAPTPPPEEEPPPEPSEDAADLPQHVVEAKEAAKVTKQVVEAAATSGVLQRFFQEPVRARVRVEEGTNVFPPAQKPEGGGAYVQITVGSDEQRSNVDTGKISRNPVWKQNFSLTGPAGTPALFFQFFDIHGQWVVYEGRYVEQRTELFLGRLRIPIGHLPSDGQELDQWYDIQDGLAQNAKVRLKITVLSGHVVLSLPGLPPNVHRAASEDNQFEPSGPQSSGWLPITVPLGVTSMGWVPVGMAPERMFIEAVLPASWAVQAKLCAEDELISVAGKDVSEYNEEVLVRVLQNRPLQMTFYRHNWHAEGEVAKKGVLRDPNQDVQLRLEVLEGKNLWACTEGEVFVVAGVRDGGRPHVTRVQVGTDPQWNECCMLTVPHGREEAVLELSAWDLELSQCDQHLGSLNIDLNKLKMGEVADWWCVLQGGAAMPGGEVRLRLQFLEDQADVDSLDSIGKQSAPRSDSLGPVHLLLEIEEATGLMKYNAIKVPEEVDAYMVFDAGPAGKPYITACIRGIGEIKWKEQTLMEVTSGTTELIVTIWDKELQLKDMPLGRVSIPLDKLPICRAVDEWYDVVDGVCSGARIRLRLTLVNTLHTQEAWDDLKEEHSDPEGSPRKLAEKWLINRARYLWEPARLQVDILECWDLVSSCVAYAMVSLGNGVQMQTTGIAVRASNCPRWEKATVFMDLPPAQEFLEVSIWDQDPFGQEDELMGVAQISLDKLWFGSAQDDWYDLTEGPIVTSKLRLRLSIHMPNREPQAEEHHLHRITVEVVEGSELRDPEDHAGTDPYIILSLGEDPYITKTAKGNENPQWNETATFGIHRDLHALQVTVWDWDPWSKEDLLGAVRIPFGTLPVNQLSDEWYSIHEGLSQAGKIHLRITLEGQAVEQPVVETNVETKVEYRVSDAAKEALLLKVEVMEGVNMTEPTEPDGVEAYVMMSIDEGEAFFTSNVAKQSREPQWNESAEVWVPKEASLVELQVWDSDYLRDDRLGLLRIPLKSLRLNELTENWYELVEGEASNAKIRLRLTLEGKEWQAEGLQDVDEDVDIANVAAPPPATRHLKIEIVGGADMAEPGASCDPYAIIKVEGEHKTYQTQVITESLFPQWNEITTFVLPAEATALQVDVWDSNYFSDGLVGTAYVVFQTLPLGTEVDQWYSLGEGTAENARIQLRLTLFEQDLVDYLDPFDPDKLEKERPNADLKIEILQGSNMTEPSEPDGCDAYVIVSLGDGQTHTTHAPKQNPSPEWNETVIFELPPKTAFLELNVWDWDLFGDEHLGAARVPLEALSFGEPVEEWYEITGGAAEGDGTVESDALECPKVLLRLTLLEKEVATAENPATDANVEESKHAKLKVAVLEGTDMKIDCNLYVILSLGEATDSIKTEAQNSGQSQKPKWNESRTLEIPRGAEALEASVWEDYVLSSDDCMGKCSIPLTSFQGGNEIDEWYTIEGGTGQGAGGKLRLRLKLLDPRLLLNLPEQRLRVDIVEGKDLTDDPSSNESSAWVSLEVKGDDDPPYKSQRIERTRCPKWDESTIFRIQSLLEIAELEINAWSHLVPHLDYTKDFLGMTRIPLRSLQVGQTVDEWHDISGGKPTNAQIRLRLLVLEEARPDFEVEKQDEKQKGLGAAFSPTSPLKSLSLSDDFRHGQLLFEVNSRRVPYIIVPRGLRDFSRLLLLLLFNWGLPSPETVLRAVGGEKHLYSEWLDTCRDICCWASKEGALPDYPAFESAHYGSGVQSTSEGRLPVTEDVISEYFANFLCKMEAFATDVCQNSAACCTWLESDASTMGIAGLLGIGARCVFRSPQAKKFVWLGLYTHPFHKERNDRNTRKFWESAVPLNEEIEVPVRIPLEETPQIPQTRYLPGKSEEDWDAFRYRHQAFINPWVTHLLLFHDTKDLDGWHEYVGYNLSVVGMACNDTDMAAFWVAEAVRLRKVLLVNYAGGTCDRFAEALKQYDAKKHVHRLNTSGLLDHPIDYKQHQSTFHKLGGAWTCELLAKMENDARTPRYMFEFQGQSDSHVTHPNSYIKGAAIEYIKKQYMVEPPPLLELPDDLVRHKVVILDLATDTQGDVSRKIYDCLCEKDILHRTEEDKGTMKASVARKAEAITRSETPSSMAVKKASFARKSVDIIPRCRFCGAEAPNEKQLAPSGGAPMQGLVAGCKCDGVNEFYHLPCLQTDFIVRCQAKETAWLDFRCLLCKQRFHGHALMELAHTSKAHLSAQLGSHSAGVARALHFLGVAHIQIGEGRIAAQLLADSLAIYEETTRLTGAFTNEMAETIHSLAKLYRRPADSVKERQALERCLAIKEKLFGTGSVETREVMLDLAVAYARAGNPGKEQELLRKVAALKVF